MEKAWLTHKGRVREHNEDSVGLFQSDHGVPVAVLADGMGGHQAGDVASRTAVQVIQRELGGLTPEAGTEERREWMLNAVTAANREIYVNGQPEQGLQRDGNDGDRSRPGKG